MLAQIEHKSFEQLADTASFTGMTPEKLILKTKDLSAATDADWEQQYEALGNLRVLNKFHFTLLCEEMIEADDGSWAGGFISTQVKNLRSHNSRNAMELFFEVCNYNNEYPV